MKYYLVKTVSVATPENQNFAGMYEISYYGKSDKQIAQEGTAPESIHTVKTLENRLFMLEEYGYKRACDAKRSWAYKNPETNRNWVSAVEIVEIEI